MYYEEEAAVPLVVSWKGVTPPRIDRTHLVSTLDVLPTICDYAGIMPPPVMRGQSLREVIEHPDRPGRESVVAEMANAPQRSFMVRTAKYKYMAFPGSGGPAEMLFDLKADPGEMKNLAGQASLPGELDRHRQLLAKWKAATEEEKYPVKAAPKPARKAKRKK